MTEDIKSLYILGIMSGTSLDGLDMALCAFNYRHSSWNYRIIKAITLPYPPELSGKLNNALHLSAEELCIFDHSYGKWIGTASGNFIQKNKLDVNCIASHGHTVFHQPEHGFTLQIGNGNDIAAITGIPVIYDFRSLDVSLGGQGAPLVPAGDEFLFGEYDYCLNLGGFSNISFKKDFKRIAFDICPANMGLNYLAGKIGFGYDENGNSGRQGQIIPEILDKLNGLDFYNRKPPKSLGREWFIEFVVPILDGFKDVNDVLRTFYEHVAIQISRILNENKGKKVLITGGGAKNKFLIELITQKTNCEIDIPDDLLIDFKEALIFAFLAYLRVNNIPNVFASVTGASGDNCGGLITGISNPDKRI